MPKSLKRLLLLLLIVVVIVGPWPISDPHYQSTEYYQNTITALEQKNLDLNSSRLIAGYAQEKITPLKKIPLAGYSSRKSKIFDDVREDVFAQVVTIKNEQNTVSIISLEVLLPLPQLVNRVVELTALPREQLFFTASHTHSGPGAYSNHWLYEYSLGEFDADYFEFLSTQIARAVMNSREQLLPVEMQYRRLTQSNDGKLIYNELIKEQHGHDSLHVLSFLLEGGQPLATLISFSAHPTILGHTNHSLDGDYPGVLQRQLSSELQSPVLFSIGAPGAMMTAKRKPKETLDQQIERRNRYAQQLVSRLHQNTNERSTRATHGVVSSWLLDVDLRRPLFHLGSQLQLAPFLPEWLMHSAESYIHALHIGGVTLFGLPSDYSGELAEALEQWSNSNGCLPVINSFNGDYIGYLSPSSRYDIPHYTTRDVNFFGRWTGDYFYELTQKICNKYASHSSNP